MRRWPVRVTDQPVASSLVAGVLAGVGTPHLAASYLRAVGTLLPLTFCTVYAVDRAGRIETVSAASAYGDTAERTARRYVEQRFDLLDPNMAWLAQRKLPARRQLWLGHQRAEEVADPAYREACYGNVGIRERASILLLLPTGQRAAVSFYRSLAQPDFSRDDFDLLEAHATLLGDATLAHGRSAPTRTAEPAAPPDAQSLSMLSLREREVVGHLLDGKTAKEAARAMAVEITTARTLQYRAFKRLDVRNLKELLRMRFA
ncbi:MAG: LuxR C-terminal-related transcriptional regulator [Gammaproteobacteria bacterium]|nr:LuxR C-terminal-related transcriptional regulator [Gammaproteobacteria bacterium]MBU1442214.1 LuxR C-terminal-related transcriptional regulator [Gammaproteobacteria bacterium]MBU2287497.1 LuxR C-terminal-related transcriptional regulator [Gammaproteobacteria bacterium]MBU2410195.1 LuxR C-terminal-related transcriptional regulator [Gammaproteobacteria bacterium]